MFLLLFWLVSFILQAVAEISVGGASSISAIWLYKMINRWTGAVGGTKDAKERIAGLQTTCSACALVAWRRPCAS